MPPPVSARPVVRSRRGIRTIGGNDAGPFGPLAYMSASDETKIRASIQECWTRPREGGLSLADEFSDAFGAAGAVVGESWATDDFRASELDRYDQLLSAAITGIHHQAEARLLDALVTACLAFEAEHPEAPRA